MAEETMAIETETGELTEKEAWGGGRSPMNIRYGKMMMWFFLLSDAFTFAAFLISYGAIRYSQPWWPDANKVFNAMPFMGHKEVPLGFVSIMTFILILSSVFVVRAVIEGHRLNKRGVLIWLGLGIIGGVAFLGCQAWEWNHLIHKGLLPSFNPFGPDAIGHTVVGDVVIRDGVRMMAEGYQQGPQAFGALFFGITGFHGFHVFTGICLNIYGFIATMNGTFQKKKDYEMIEKLGLYWHFVDLVWVFVFMAFYLF